MSAPEAKDPKSVSLFATCLVDALYPRVGAAVVQTLERAGCEVDLPEGQTCCGLPFYNNGYVAEATRLAQNTIAALEGQQPVVVPSGSCAWMMRSIYPRLLPAGEAFSKRVVEYSELLSKLPGWTARTPPAAGKVTYHPSCHLLRGLHVEKEPKSVLGRIEGLSLCPMDREKDCCGFGGSFSVRYPEVSTSMLEDKLASAQRTGAETIVVTDVGCLMQLEGGQRRREAGPRVIHLAELLEESAPKDR